MALPTSIHTLLSGNVVEWARIEFKESWKPEASLKTITAFANDVDNWGGGYIILGVEEDRNGRPVKPIKGLPLAQIDSIMKDLYNKCRLISPDYIPVVEPVDYDENTKLLVIWCPGGPVRPYHCPTEFTYERGKAKASKETTCWIRKMASTVKPSDQDLADLYVMANHVPFDDQICHQADMTDLNITLIRAYLKEVGSDLYEESAGMNFNQLCSQMEISNSTPEYMKPRNVGLLFFSLNPEKYMPCARIDIVEFPDGVGGDHIEEHIFRGPLHQQLRDALRYISNNIIEERIVKHPDKAEADRYFNYPYPAIEEALANAVYHKSYSIREPIEVRIERDKIEVLSYPGPDRSVTIDALRNFNVLGRKYRNRRIGDYLKELHLTEGRNTGFGKILRALKKNGSPLPEFITDDEHSFFVTRLHIHDGFYEDDNQGQTMVKQPEQTARNEEFGTRNEEFGTRNEEFGTRNEELGTRNEEFGTRNEELGTHENINENQVSNVQENNKDLSNHILQMISKDNKISRKKMAEELSISERTIQRILNTLPLIHYVGKGKNGHWELSDKE